MRKLVLLGLVFTLASGCGRGWLPMFRGAPCTTGTCGAVAPALPAAYDAGCRGCGRSAGYDNYDSESLSFGGAVSGDTYYGGGVIDTGVVDGPILRSDIVNGTYSGQGTIVSPPMSSLPQSTPAN